MGRLAADTQLCLPRTCRKGASAASGRSWGGWGLTAEASKLLQPSELFALPPPYPHTDELWAQLGELGIDKEVPHPAFGRTAEQLKTFCARR